VSCLQPTAHFEQDSPACLSICRGHCSQRSLPRQRASSSALKTLLYWRKQRREEGPWLDSPSPGCVSRPRRALAEALCCDATAEGAHAAACQAPRGFNPDVTLNFNFLATERWIGPIQTLLVIFPDWHGGPRASTACGYQQGRALFRWRESKSCSAVVVCSLVRGLEISIGTGEEMCTGERAQDLGI